MWVDDEVKESAGEVADVFRKIVSEGCSYKKSIPIVEELCYC